MVDVVIPFSLGSKWDNNEIRYCLRSLERNLIDLGKVFIIGERLEWMSNQVIFIPYPDTFKENKDANIINKVIRACKEEGVSENFIRISDDQILLKPTLSKNITPLYNGNLEKIFRKLPDNQINRFRKRLRNTKDILLKEGKTTFNYEIHIPTLVNKQSFIDILESYNYGVEGEGFTINSLYLNNINSPLAKQVEGEKVQFEKEFGDKEYIKNSIKDALYLGYNDKGLSSELKFEIMHLFPIKSKYELY